MLNFSFLLTLAKLSYFADKAEKAHKEYAGMLPMIDSLKISLSTEKVKGL
jgi:hypothetical protein